MTDLEVADEIEQHLKETEDGDQWRAAPLLSFWRGEWKRIIVALRRDPEPIHRECEQCGMMVACWSDAQIEAIERSAAALHAKIKPLIR